MLLIAATAAENLQKIPTKFWINLGIGVALLVGGVIIFRKIAQMNKVLLAAIVFVVVVGLGFHWVYERNEPAFLTPVVEKLAPFFPSKGAYAGKQTK